MIHLMQNGTAFHMNTKVKVVCIVMVLLNSIMTQFFCQHTETALKGFLAQKFKDEKDCPDIIERDQDTEARQKAADTVC